MATTASASSEAVAADYALSMSKRRSATPPHQDPSASQSLASTSSIRLDEPDTTCNTVTHSSPMKMATEVDGTMKEEQEDEDAKLLASLASDISRGVSSQAASLVSLDESSVKAEKSNAMPVNSEADGTFSGLAEDASGPIQAYAKLEFPGFSYYIQTLDCTIGRRPAHMRTPALRDGEAQHITGAKKMEGDVDVDLGLLKSISRLHVRIFYQDQPRHNGERNYDTEAGPSGSQGRFVLQVLGRNGCFVDDVPAEREAIVPLGKRTKIQIAERVFYFVLPPASLNKQYNSDGELGSDAYLDGSEEDSGSLGSSEEEEIESSASISSEEDNESEIPDELENDENDAGMKKRPKLVLKKKPVSSATGGQGKGKGKGKGKHQGKTIWEGKGISGKRRKEEEEIEEAGSGEDIEDVQVKKTSGKGSSKKVRTATAAKENPVEAEVSGRKRKRGSGADPEQTLALKVGTPIGVETLSKPKKKKKKEINGDSADVANEESKPAAMPGNANGKGGGKAHIVAAALAAKAKADEEGAKATNSLPAHTVNGKATSTPAISVQNGAVRAMAGNAVRPTPNTPAGKTPSRPPVSSRPLQSNVRPASTGPSGPLSYTRPPEPAQVSRPNTNVQQAAPMRPLDATASTTSPTPFPPSSAAFAHLASQNRPPSAASPQPLPPAGPGIKPDHSNIDLIREALANPISLSRGGKLTLQEIYEDISSRHEWYRNNNRSNGRDWHSSIRHAVGNSKDMVRIPKKPNEQGKGVFYAISGSEAAKAYRLEEQADGVLPNQASHSASPTPPIVSTAAAAAKVSPRPPLPSIINHHHQQPAVPPPPPAAAARPSPPIQPNGRVSIVIGKAPTVALTQHAALPKSAMTKNIEVLFKGPPIVHHEGTLYLNPVIFGHMSASEVNDIGGKGAQTALALLQGQLVKHLQTVMKPGQGASPRPARPPPLAAASGSGTASPQTSRPAPLPANGVQGASAPRPQPVVANRPVQGRPGLPSSAAMHSARPGPPVSMATHGLGRPPPSGVANPVRPMNNGVPRPTNRPGTGPNRPQQPLGQSRPAALANGQATVAQPLPPSTQMPRPPLNQGAASTPPGSQSTAIPARPVAASSSGGGQQRPLQRPLQAQPLPRPAPTAPRPPPAAPPLAVRPAARPAQPTSAAPSSSSGPSVSAAAAPAPSSNAVMSAMSALASHPDAAGLMTLLSGGKVESGTKLTPGQLDLLQRAGRIAAEQQKTQQQQQQQKQKVDPEPAPAPAPTSSAAPASQ